MSTSFVPNANNIPLFPQILSFMSLSDILATRSINKTIRLASYQTDAWDDSHHVLTLTRSHITTPLATIVGSLIELFNVDPRRSLVRQLRVTRDYIHEYHCPITSTLSDDDRYRHMISCLLPLVPYLQSLCLETDDVESLDLDFLHHCHDLQHLYILHRNSQIPRVAQAIRQLPSPHKLHTLIIPASALVPLSQPYEPHAVHLSAEKSSRPPIIISNKSNNKDDFDSRRTISRLLTFASTCENDLLPYVLSMLSFQDMVASRTIHRIFYDASYTYISSVLVPNLKCLGLMPIHRDIDPSDVQPNFNCLLRFTQLHSIHIAYRFNPSQFAHVLQHHPAITNLSCNMEIDANTDLSGLVNIRALRTYMPRINPAIAQTILSPLTKLQHLSLHTHHTRDMYQFQHPLLPFPTSELVSLTLPLISFLGCNSDTKQGFPYTRLISMLRPLKRLQFLELHLHPYGFVFPASPTDQHLLVIKTSDLLPQLDTLVLVYVPQMKHTPAIQLLQYLGIVSTAMTTTNNSSMSVPFIMPVVDVLLDFQNGCHPHHPYFVESLQQAYHTIQLDPQPYDIATKGVETGSSLVLDHAVRSETFHILTGVGPSLVPHIEKSHYRLVPIITHGSK